MRQIPATGRCLCNFVLTAGEVEGEDDEEVLLGDGVPAQSGDMDEPLFSALRGCNRSGESALRNNGELGSALLGRAKDFLLELAVFIDATGTVGLHEEEKGAGG